MTLPTDPDLSWPPKDPASDEVQVWSAWYSGNPEDLAYVYGGTFVLPKGTIRPAQPWYHFWSRRSPTGIDFGRAKLHVPLAGDLAAASADLLFADPPDWEGLTDAQLIALDALAADTGLYRTLIESAELCAALGGIYLVPRWDKTLADHPFVAAVHPDSAVPTFRFDRLTGVLFHRIVAAEGQTVWRHLESHDVMDDGLCTISHAVYRGTQDKLGTPEGDRQLATLAGVEPTVETGIIGLDVSYVPNMRPNRRFRDSSLGRSDFQGAEGLMDALDESWTSWMRDIRLGQSRIIVAKSVLKAKAGRGYGPEFDLDQEAFTPLDMDPASAEKAPITHVQAALRVADHSKTTLDLIERIVVAAGWAPQTFGLAIEGRAESGTALNVRERRTFVTRARKRSYWEPAIEEQIEHLLHYERQEFGRQVEPGRPQVKWRETLGDDPLQLATTLEMLKRAEAASTAERVRRLHPEWDDAAVDEEVSLIDGETAKPPPVIAPPMVPTPNGAVP